MRALVILIKNKATRVTSGAERFEVFALNGLLSEQIWITEILSEILFETAGVKRTYFRNQTF